MPEVAYAEYGTRGVESREDVRPVLDSRERSNTLRYAYPADAL